MKSTKEQIQDFVIRHNGKWPWPDMYVECVHSVNENFCIDKDAFMKARADLENPGPGRPFWIFGDDDYVPDPDAKWTEIGTIDPETGEVSLSIGETANPSEHDIVSAIIEMATAADSIDDSEIQDALMDIVTRLGGILANRFTGGEHE